MTAKRPRQTVLSIRKTYKPGAHPVIEIRDARTADIPALALLGAETFAGTFQHLYSEKDLSAFLSAYHSEDFYNRVLNSPDQKLYIADDGGSLAGYALVKPNSLPCEPPRRNALELSRLYLRASYRGQGVGHDLMKAVLAHAREKHALEMVLSVYSENFGAHKFYKRYGFRKIGDYGFLVGNHVDAEWIMLTDL